MRTLLRAAAAILGVAAAPQARYDAMHLKDTAASRTTGLTIGHHGLEFCSEVLTSE